MSQVVNALRQDEHGAPLPAPTTGPVAPLDLGGTPRIGVTVFDPTGEWRKLGKLVPGRDFRYYSLTDPQAYPLRFNPLRIPSPHVDPAKWAAALAKHWLLAYPAGATGFHQLKGAVLDAYRAAGVIAPDGSPHPERSANLCMATLHAALQARLDKLRADRSDNITAGVVIGCFVSAGS